MFYIPIKLKPELARTFMTTSDVLTIKFPTANNLTQIKFTTKNSTILRFIQMCFGPRFYRPIKLPKKFIQFLNAASCQVKLHNFFMVLTTDCFEFFSQRNLSFLNASICTRLNIHLNMIFHGITIKFQFLVLKIYSII